MSADPTRHVYTHPSPVEHWRHLIEIVALIIAAVWGFYVFVYQERIKPAAEPVNLDFAIHVEHQNLMHGKELVTIQPTWHNGGAVQAQMDGFLLDVYGITYGPGPKTISVVRPATTPAPGFNAAIATSRAMRPQIRLVATFFRPWRPLGGEYWGLVDPGDTLAPKITLALPRGEYEAISLTYTFCFRRRDDSQSFTFVPVRDPDGGLAMTSLFSSEHKVMRPESYHCQIQTGQIFAL